MGNGARIGDAGTIEAGAVERDCPKHMVYGPCGGVRPDLRCELDDRRCPFVDRPLVRWAGPDAAPLDTGDAAPARRAPGRSR